jgi:hypothetical protein
LRWVDGIVDEWSAIRKLSTVGGATHRLIAACLKALRDSSSFFVPPLPNIAVTDTLRAAGAEDKPLLGSKLSADSGAKTRLGFGEKLSPSGELISLGLASTR